MEYLLLIYHSEAGLGKMTPADTADLYREYGQLRDELAGKGKFLGGSQLMPTTVATTVRVRDGKRVVTDGPFAETKEQLGGYFLVRASDLDEAIAIAARIPSARNGTIEVRPLAVRGQAKPA
jgi:hypothetical protein